MKISVVICTHNRAGSLRRTLESLTRQILPRDEFEVLVIDNVSTDDTKMVTESFTNLHIKYIYEPTLGLSQARNTGWQAANSNYIAYIDDDAEASPGWLESLLTTFDAYPEQEVMVGGRVELDLTIPRPYWLDPLLQVYLGELTSSPGISKLNTTAHYLPGCNIAFKKTTLLKYGGFPILLGRSGKNLLSGEEILLQKKVLADGGDIMFNNNALVTHHVATNRLTKRWFIKRLYWEGVTNRKLESLLGVRTSLKTELVPLLKQVFSFGFLFKARFSDVCIAAKRLGRVLESIRPH